MSTDKAANNMSEDKCELPRVAPPCHTGSVRLIGIDLDGTLLRSDKTLNKDDVLALREAAKLGVKIVLTSARPPRTVNQFWTALGLDTLQINYNGALIYDPCNKQAVEHHPISAKLAREMVDHARALDPEVLVSLEILDTWYTDRHDPQLAMETARSFDPDYEGPLDDVLNNDVTKIMLLAPPERMQAIQNDLVASFQDRISFAISDQHLLQCMASGVDKSAALSWVAGYYRIPSRECMVIGDAPNDIGMIRWAGVGCAVANAWDEVRQYADYLVPSNDLGGVGEAVRRFAL